MTRERGTLDSVQALRAFAALGVVLYAPMPRSEMDTQRFVTLGHELMHCFDGNWHDRWGRMNHAESQAAAGAARKSAGAAAAAN